MARDTDVIEALEDKYQRVLIKGQDLQGTHT